MMLRPMIGTDIAALWPTFKALCADGLTLVQDETTTAETFEAYWTDRGGEQWTVLVEDRVVGGFTLRSNHTGRGAHVGTATYIVAEHARGRGVGTLPRAFRHPEGKFVDAYVMHRNIHPEEHP